MRNLELGPKFELRKEERISKGELKRIELREKFQQETIQKLIEATEVLGTTISTKIEKSKYLKYYVRFKRHKKEWGYKNWEDLLIKEGLRIPMKEETIQKLKEGVKELGTTSSEKIERSEYVKYYDRLRKHKEEWGYKNWGDFLVKEGLKMPFKQETIQGLKEAVRELRTTSSKKIKLSEEYVKYYTRLQRHREEWDYKDWDDFLAKEGLEPIREFEKLAREIAKDAWNAFLEKYGDVIHIPQVSTKLFVGHFLERKYPKEKEKIKTRVVSLLDNWRKKEVEKISKEKIKSI